MAASKSASRTAAAKKAAKTRKSRAAAKKAAKTRKRRVAGKKAAATRRQRKVVAISPAVAELDARIAIVRNNLRDLVELAAANSGASSEELLAERIADHEAKLAALRKQRDDLER